MTPLYHATSEEGAEGIKARGFGLSHLPDSAGQSWFADDPDECLRLAVGRDWIVALEMPDEVAERYLYHFEDGTEYPGNYLVPWDVVNEYRPFQFERIPRDP